MLSILRFIFKFVADFCSMLFTIDVDNNLSIGLLLCIIFILLPIVHRVICFIRQDAIDELNSRYEESRPRESHYAEKHTTVNKGNGTSISYTHSFSKSRRYKHL